MLQHNDHINKSFYTTQNKRLQRPNILREEDKEIECNEFKKLIFLMSAAVV